MGVVSSKVEFILILNEVVKIVVVVVILKEFVVRGWKVKELVFVVGCKVFFIVILDDVFDIFFVVGIKDFVVKVVWGCKVKE